jgi:hypothetical protein
MLLETPPVLHNSLLLTFVVYSWRYLVRQFSHKGIIQELSLCDLMFVLVVGFVRGQNDLCRKNTGPDRQQLVCRSA